MQSKNQLVFSQIFFLKSSYVFQNIITQALGKIKSPPSNPFAFLVCGKVLEEEGGVLTSPNYPNHYPDRLRCEWDISVPFGSIVMNITDFWTFSKDDRLTVMS